MKPPAVAPSPANQQLVHNSLLLVGIEGVSKLLGLVFFVLLARYLGATELGIYAAALTWANFFILLPKFGLENLVQREVGRQPEAARDYWRRLGLLKAVLTGVALLGLGLTLRLLFQSQWLVMWFLGVFACAYSFLEFADTFFRAWGRASNEVLVRLWFSLSNLLLGAALLLAGGRLSAVALGQFLSVSSALLLAGWRFYRLAPASPEARLTPGYWALLRQAAPFAGIVAALFCSNQVGMLLLSVLQPETAVGFLAAGLRLFDNLTLLPAAVMGAFLPVASRQYRTSLRAFVLTCRYTWKYLFLLVAPLAVGLFCLARPLTLFLYRDEFLPTAWVLQLLAPALVCSFWNYLGDNLLIASNREGRLLALAWLAAAIHVGANLVLVPRYAYLGAAAATLLTQAGYSLILGWQLRRYWGRRQLWTLMGRPAACAAGMGLLVWWLQDLPVLLVVAGGALSYLALLVLSRTVTATEWTYLRMLWRWSPVAVKT